MRRLLLCAALTLAACAPSPEAGTLTRIGGDLVLVNPGPGLMTETVLRVDGTGLILPAPCVARAPNTYGCVVGALPEGGSFRIGPVPDAAGHLGVICNASANFYRAGDTLFRRLETRCAGQP